MATRSYQPLLETPKRRKNTTRNVAYLLISLLAIITPLAYVATKLTSYPNHFGERICHNAHDRASCLQVISEVVPFGSVPRNDAYPLRMLLKKHVSQVRRTIRLANDVRQRANDKREQAAIADCLELMDESTTRLLDSIIALGDGTMRSHVDAHTWLSSVLTNHVTCMDGLIGTTKSILEPSVQDLISRGRAILAMIVAVSPTMREEPDGEFPSWVTASDRKLLQAASPEQISPNLTVAQDGSGDFLTVQAAVDAAKNHSVARFVIYVRNGTYAETVRIPKGKTNLMLVGDGMDLTVITGNLSVVDGSTTFNSATLAVTANGFMAQDIWFQNTAGPQKHQAVALRVGSDQSVINRCKIDAYQDTLYTISLRQFYRDCYITGTIDYIFGNAAVVFQNCQIVSRLPMSGQFNTVTAQGRIDPNQNTGTSIQGCNITASDDLEPVIGTVNSYLGRPWKEYAVTVVMQSYIDNSINPAGWAPWDGTFALSTLFYGEYMNLGPGAGTSQRVTWPGYQVITSPDVAANFTVAELIQGGAWLPNTGVTFVEGL